MVVFSVVGITLRQPTSKPLIAATNHYQKPLGFFLVALKIKDNQLKSPRLKFSKIPLQLYSLKALNRIIPVDMVELDQLKGLHRKFIYSL
jgi:hypothetical protein